MSESNLRNWHANAKLQLEGVLPREVFDNPSRWFNLDETMLYFNPDSTKKNRVLAKKGSQVVYLQANNEKSGVTLLHCFNAKGEYPRPLILFKGKTRNSALANSVPQELTVDFTDSGWMQASALLRYIRDIFVPWLQEKGLNNDKVVLTFDGHRSHINYELSRFCLENKIELLCFFPNATHILQPADVGIFGPLKGAWKHHISEYKAGICDENGIALLERVGDHPREIKKNNFAAHLPRII